MPTIRQFKAIASGVLAGEMRSLVVLMGLSLGLWISAVMLVVPAIIRRAYQGQSFPILNRIIGGKAEHDVDFYLSTWNEVAIAISAALLILCIVILLTRTSWFFKKVVGETTPGTLGAIRALVCSILFVSAIWEDLASAALLPREMRDPKGLMQLLYFVPGFEAFVSSEGLLRIFEILTVLLLLAAAIGWKTRIAVPLGALCYLMLGGIIREYTWFYHVGLVPLYAMAVLALTPCGDGFSVDRLSKIYRGLPVPPADRPQAIYGWSRYSCWLVVALAYVAAGLSKVGNDGLFWFSAANLKRIMLRDTLNLMEFDWGVSLYFVQAPDYFFSFLAIATVLGELSFVLVLFSRVARLIVPGIMMMMHIGILFFQNVLFPDLVAIQLMFYDFRPTRQRISEWLARRAGSVEVLYDGFCPLCRRTVRVLSTLDIFKRLTPLDFRQLNLAEYNRRHGTALSIQALETEMSVVSKNGSQSGFYAYRTIAKALPGLWVLVPWLYLPGIAIVGKWIYTRIARKRFGLHICNASCAVKTTDEKDNDSYAINEPDRSWPFRWIVPGLAFLLVFCWVLRIEFYPFTAMQMYTKWGAIRPITYYKVFAHYESGQVTRAPLEEAIGALADSRYRTVIAMAFSPEKADVCKKYLIATANAYNRKALPGQRVIEFDVQRWTWDLFANPGDPNHGTLSERVLFRVEPGSRSPLGERAAARLW